MDKQTLLEKTAAQVRLGITEEFENFYILTVQDAFQAASTVTSKDQIQDLIINAYVILFNQKEKIPVSEPEIRNYVKEAVIGQIEKEGKESAKEPEQEEKISENLAAELWLTVERKTGISPDDSREEEEENGESTLGQYIKSFLRVTLMFAVMGAAVFFLYRGVIHFLSDSKEKEAAVSAETSGEISEENSKSKNGESPAGTEETKEMSDLSDSTALAQLRLEGSELLLVSEQEISGYETFCQGRQTLIFENGRLEQIEKNSQTESSDSAFYDGRVMYTVKNGDIYRKVPGKTEECAVRNGHVVWADFRCQNLWYVCSYQIPNSEKVKMTAYKADPAGKNQTEIVTDSALLSNQELQFTDNWVYYRKGSFVFRKSLQDDRKERMAKTQEEYFAFEDTLFYMDGGDLKSISEGESSYNEEKEYEFSMENGQIVMTDEEGEPAEADENGQIVTDGLIYSLKGNTVTAVKQGEQTYNNEVFYLYGNGTDRKIYRRAQEKESTALAAQNGIHTDSFCIIGKWLYYSACMESIDGVQYSQIYRADLDTMAQEKVGRLFQGVITAMYPDKEEGIIYGEYIADTRDGKLHGSICAIMDDGQMGIIEDSVPRSSGNDRLSFAAVQGDDIYCFYHECDFDEETGIIRDLTSQAVKIEW